MTAGRGRGTLPSREERGKGIAMGSSSRFPDDVFEEEHEEEREENTMIGPLKLHRPIKTASPFETPRQTINYMKHASKVNSERHVNPYEYEKNVTDYRFWNDFQSDFYETVILTKKKPITHMQWIDWDYMAQKNDYVFNEVIAACEHHGI